MARRTSWIGSQTQKTKATTWAWAITVLAAHKVHRWRGERPGLEAKPKRQKQQHGRGPSRFLLRRNGYLGGKQHGDSVHTAPMQHRWTAQVRGHRVWGQRQGGTLRRRL